MTTDYTPTVDEMRFAMAGLRMTADRFVTAASFDRAIANVRADEAMRCAALADLNTRHSYDGAHYAADAIRARAATIREAVK